MHLPGVPVESRVRAVDSPGELRIDHQRFPKQTFEDLRNMVLQYVEEQSFDHWKMEKLQVKRGWLHEQKGWSIGKLQVHRHSIATSLQVMVDVGTIYTIENPACWLRCSLPGWCLQIDAAIDQKYHSLGGKMRQVYSILVWSFYVWLLDLLQYQVSHQIECECFKCVYRAGTRRIEVKLANALNGRNDKVKRWPSEGMQEWMRKGQKKWVSQWVGEGQWVSESM